MMLSVNLKDSALTTRSSTNYVDVKSKTKKYIMTEYECLYKKTYVYCTFSRSQYNSRTCFFFKKELSLLGAAPNRQNFQGSYFLKRVTKLVNDTQQSIVVVVEPLLDAPCIACRISLLPRPLRIELKSADPSGLNAIYH